MGLMSSNTNNKHMLTQMANVVNYKVSLNVGLSEYNINSYNKLGVVSASANVWDGNIIPRKKASYLWVADEDKTMNADGTYALSDFNSGRVFRKIHLGFNYHLRIIRPTFSSQPSYHSLRNHRQS